MKVLIACEFSGIVREAFIKRGHDAWSCDLLPTEIPGNHIQGDVLEILNNGWELMIAHPPCTYLANSGLHYLSGNPVRQTKMQEAFNFVLKLWNSPINRVCIENPTGRLNTDWFTPSQTIQPYYFGDNERKTTCLWLKNLPILMYTHVLPNPKPRATYIRKTGKKKGQIYREYHHGVGSSHERSRTFQGIADAMADQWGSYY